tara:strand:- start:170 stop:517 length:348 start_codon:yes stop_codon:yes gene_type:complete
VTAATAAAHQHRAPAHILHHDPQLGAGDVGAVIARDVRRVALRHHRDLLLDVVDLVLGLLQIDNLDGDDLARREIDAAVDLAERAAPDALQLAEALLRRDIHRGAVDLRLERRGR